MKAGPLVASGLVHVGVLWVLVAMEREPAGAGGDDRGLIQFEPVSAVEPEPEQEPEPEPEPEQDPEPEAKPEPDPTPTPSEPPRRARPETATPDPMSPYGSSKAFV